MKDAEITNMDKETKQVEDSLLNVDDLIMEIGKQHVEKMNSVRLSVLYNNKLGDIQKTLGEKLSSSSKFMKENKALLQSNTLYQENNRKLDVALTSIKEKNKELQLESNQKEVVIIGLNKELSLLKKSDVTMVSLKGENLELHSENDLSKDKIKELKKSVKELTKEVKKTRKIKK